MQNDRLSGQVEIRHDGRCMDFIGDLPSEVRAKLVTKRRTYSSGIRIQQEPLVDSNNKIADLGLVDAVVSELHRCEIPVRLAESLLPPPLDAQMTSRRAHAFRDSDVIEFVNTAREGIIEYSPGVSPVRLMVQIARAYPGRKIVIPCHSGEKVAEITRQIRSEGIATTSLVRRQIGEHEHVHNVVVTTPYGLEDGAVEFQQSDIVLFENAKYALHDQARYELSKSDCRFRLFGFFERGQHLAKYERDLLVSLFGFRQIAVPRHGHRLTDVRVAFLPIFGPKHPNEEKLLALKRRGIFHNHRRHRLIAKVARRLVEGDATVYEQLFPDVAPESRIAEPKSVAVVVENVQHAEAIRERLRGWAIWIGARERQPANNDRVVRSGFGHGILGETSEFICTVDGLRTAPLQNTDIIIWAAAGSSGPLLPASRLVRPYGAERPLLVVDVVDTQHPQLAAWSRHRERDYLDREWIPLGCDRHQFRLLRFLQERE